MRRFTCIILIISVLMVMCACGSTASSSPAATETEVISAGETAEPEVIPTDEAEPSESPEQEEPEESSQPSEEPIASDEPKQTDIDWKTIYSDFLSSNYDTLSQLIFEGIAGVGFADLDLDGIAEMILFDYGASASMGVQFFDIVDGDVQCISANMEDLGTEFGGDYFTKLFVNANLFEDFRLVRDGENAFFTVKSWNGAQDFMYEEIITFTQGSETSTGAVLTLSSVAYRYDEYDTETGETTTSRFESSGSSITEEKYNSVIASVDSWTDLGMDVRGKFIWENTDYTSDLNGIMAMTRDAIADYQSASDFLSD